MALFNFPSFIYTLCIGLARLGGTVLVNENLAQCGICRQEKKLALAEVHKKQ